MDMESARVPVLEASPSRRRHVRIAIVALVVLLAVYAGTLAWVTRRLETDVQKSIHPVPAVRAADNADR